MAHASNMVSQLIVRPTQDETAQSVERSIAELGSQDLMTRQRARAGLVAIGREAVTPLIEELKSPASHVCWEAAKALGEIKDPSAAKPLVETLQHVDGDVRWVAAEALIALETSGLKATLSALLTKADSVPLQRGARHVISHFAHCKSGEFLKPLLARFRAFEPAVAIPPAAFNALNSMERPPLS